MLMASSPRKSLEFIDIDMEEIDGKLIKEKAKKLLKTIKQVQEKNENEESDESSDDVIVHNLKNGYAKVMNAVEYVKEKREQNQLEPTSDSSSDDIVVEKLKIGATKAKEYLKSTADDLYQKALLIREENDRKLEQETESSDDAVVKFLRCNAQVLQEKVIELKEINQNRPTSTSTSDDIIVKNLRKAGITMKNNVQKGVVAAIDKMQVKLETLI